MIRVELHDRVPINAPPILAHGQQQVPNSNLVGSPGLALGILGQLSTVYGMNKLAAFSISTQAQKWLDAVDPASSPIIHAAILDQLVELRAVNEAQLLVLGEILSAIKQAGNLRSTY